MMASEVDDGADMHKFEGCPRDDCGGNLQYQTHCDAQCLSCGEVFCHEIRSDRHLLWDFDDTDRVNEVVDRVE